MTRVLSAALIACFSLLASAPAFADDILFLGLNAAYHEMMAAKKAAEKTGRRLVIYPELSEAEWKKYYELSQNKAEIEKRLRREMDRSCDRILNSNACREARKKYRVDSEKALASLNELTEKATFRQEDFKKFLETRKSEQKPGFGSVIVSGHDGTGSLSGDLGAIEDHDLADILEGAGLRDTVRSLHLWGCYTASPSSLLLNWKKTFPNIHFVAGYDGRAPLSDKPAGWDYLQGVIEREEKLHQITDAKKLQDALKAIPGALQLNAAIANCETYASTKEAFDLAELQQQCQRYANLLKANVAKYECFFRAAPGCESVPADTSQGVLRDFYGILQKADACREAVPSPIFQVHSRDEALRLLFYPNVAKNFVTNEAKLLADVDEALAGVGAPASLRFANIDKANRAEVKERFDHLARFIEGNFKNFDDDPRKLVVDVNTARLYMLLQFHRVGTGTLSQLRSGCAPYSWHAPDSKDHLLCADSEELGRKGVDNALRAGATTKNWALEQRKNNLNAAMNNGSLGHSEGDNLLYQARLRLIDAAALNEGNDTLDRAQAGVEWAETIRRLERNGVENPTAHPEALALQYQLAGTRMKTGLREFQRELEALGPEEEDDADGVQRRRRVRDDLKVNELSLAALETKQRLFAPELSAEERKDLESTLQQKEAALGTSLVARERNNLLRMEESSRKILEGYRARPEAQRTQRGMKYVIHQWETKLNQTRTQLEKLDQEPAAFVAKQLQEVIYAPPVSLPKPSPVPGLEAPEEDENN